MADDFDIVSDLNGGTEDATISANRGTVAAHGDDAVTLNEGPRAPKEKPVTQVTDDAAPAKPPSLRDQISSALKGQEDTPPAGQQDGGPARNPDGTFAAKPAEAPKVDPNAPAPAAPATTAAPAGIDPQVFASLPAETQAQLARTMEDVGARQQRFATLEPLEQVITPRVEAWAMNGMSPAQAVHQLLALSDFAGRDPGGFIKYIAQNNGVDLEQLVLGMEPAEPVDPTIAALQKEISELKGHVQGQTQQQAQAAHERTVNGVVEFAAEKGQDGQPLRPYFAELGEAVLPYISMVKAQNPNWPHNQVLQEAYDRACWSTKTVRDKMQVAANAAADAERLRTQAKKVEGARAASVSMPSGVPTSPPVAPNDPSRTIRETVRAAIAAHSS